MERLASRLYGEGMELVYNHERLTSECTFPLHDFRKQTISCWQCNKANEYPGEYVSTDINTIINVKTFLFIIVLPS